MVVITSTAGAREPSARAGGVQLLPGSGGGGGARATPLHKRRHRRRRRHVRRTAQRADRPSTSTSTPRHAAPRRDAWQHTTTFLPPDVTACTVLSRLGDQTHDYITYNQAAPNRLSRAELMLLYRFLCRIPHRFIPNFYLITYLILVLSLARF